MSFIVKVWSTITSDFIVFLQLRNKGISDETRKHYLSDLRYYITNYFENSTMFDSYNDLFDRLKISDYLSKRTGATAKAALSNLLEYYLHTNRIPPHDYLQIKREIKSYVSSVNDELDFMSLEDVDFIFSKKVEYRFYDRDSEARIIAPLVWSLAYHALFEQKHIQSLTWNDVNLEGGIIRNIRGRDDYLAEDVIKMDEITINAFRNYIDYFGTKIKRNEFLIHINGKKANNAGINKMLAILNGRVENSSKLSTNVNIQKLNRSKILHDLLSSNGERLINYYKILGNRRNKQLENALNEYLLQVRSRRTYGI
ncbi:hypothetical protein SAMN05720606_109208 [Paenibacillus polysaccharolyticus]|uniref:Core-binding (CB) domain-containing protein n=1 Tax=Paenibacillus polysaccharolyticus TaxID=582692 RepID=A0A1G5IVQ7_9BACL|nr:hypothetical protein [Paenibacillus polysaccharolyticus]SCY80097.1 hypothetical protein SAMN05720606_109208 [Paenibacillus polysaccharolyticus]